MFLFAFSEGSLGCTVLRFTFLYQPCIRNSVPLMCQKRVLTVVGSLVNGLRPGFFDVLSSPSNISELKSPDGRYKFR